MYDGNTARPCLRRMEYLLLLGFVLTILCTQHSLTCVQFFAIVQSCLVFWEVGAGLATSGNMLTPDTINMLQKVRLEAAHTLTFAHSLTVLVRYYGALFVHGLPVEMRGCIRLSTLIARAESTMDLVWCSGALQLLGCLFGVIIGY